MTKARNMNRHEAGWTVGAEVWVLPSQNYSASKREPYPCVISKIGRRWISIIDGKAPVELDRGRFDAETRHLDGQGYSSPGRVYASLDQLEEDTEAGRLWVELIHAASGGRPAHLTSADLSAMLATIRGEGQ